MHCGIMGVQVGKSMQTPVRMFYKNKRFSQAVHNKYNMLRMKRMARNQVFLKLESNFIAG